MDTVQPLIRATFTATASAAALLVVSEPIDPQVAMADSVKDALYVLQRLPPTNLPDGAVAALLPPEELRCDFTQTMCGAYVDSARWAFVLPHSEQDKTFNRQHTEDFIRWTREGQYTLTLFQSGDKPNEPGGF